VSLSDRAAPFGLPSGVACLSQFFQFSFDFGCGVSDVLHRFGQPLLRYIELVSPVLHFMRLKKADSASVLWTRAGEIVRHAFSSDLEVNAVASWQVPGIVRICAPWPAARGKASCTSKQLLRAGCPTPSLSADVGMHVRSAVVVRPSSSGGQDALPVHECTIPQVEPVQIQEIERAKEHPVRTL
jgi:hypothetical protein